ncbi:MAG: carbohydrate binding family 9 domain-containing protein [Gemmatimonadaceae bacterium]|nr:carbohydrate binding family 9 domain-containing protein [Gemmatimonadaceae bacterium]
MPFPRPAIHARAAQFVARVACALCLATSLNAQSARETPAPFPAPDSQTVGRAVRAATAPVIDGRDDDAVWRSAPAMTDFRQFDPGENLPATFRSEARVAYDDRNLYVLVRAFDPHPDSIVSLLSRRDVKTASDQLKIIVDAYKDRRSGIELAVNPAGVKRDFSMYGDVTEDATWDGVWDVGTSIDSLGWVAEFRVPLSQLRFTAKDIHEFGFGVWRDVARLNQRDAWPAYRPSRRTLVSQLGTIMGIERIGTPRRLELLPYTVTKSVPNPAARAGGDHGELTGGLDLKAGLGSHVTVDATVNPDFGQVEADPAVLNLSAFEIRFDERRPFFQEGAGLYRCNGPCEGIFYTRRIGRTPQLRSATADPVFTNITAAAKITGRFDNGVAFGLVNASTERVRGVNGNTIEPQTNYLVARALRELRGGRSQLGVQLTDVRRQRDVGTDAFLRRSATTLLLQGFHRFAHDRWEWSGYTGLNDVRGSARSIALTQRNSVHLYQRPDHEQTYDSTRTAMGGLVFSTGIKQVGGRTRYENVFRYASAGVEFNDLGFVNLVNDASFRQQVDLRQLRPSRVFRSAFSTASLESHWTTGGVLSAQVLSVHTSGGFHNNWGGAITTSLSDFGGTYCVSCARGGPALRQSSKQGIRFDLVGDPRPSVVPKFAYRIGNSDGGRSWYRGADAGVDLRVASRFSTSLNVSTDEITNDQQWVGNFGAFLSDTTHFTFARLHQHILAVTARGNWTATPTLSLQIYAQPFVSTGDYADWRALGNVRDANYDARFSTYRTTAPRGFNVKQFNSNAVLRWEYRPASTLFLVWQQGRAPDELNPGSFAPRRDLQNLFDARPLNTVLLKISYWFNP